MGMEKRANIHLTLDQGLAIERDLADDLSSAELARVLGVPKAYLLRRSVDARKRNNVHFIATVGVGAGEGAPQAVVPYEQRETPPMVEGPRVVVVGTGPAGLFAALELAEAGLCPIVIERGAPVEQRRADVEAYKKTRVLNTASNVQFGEGGAGTFSDGKLTCGKNSPLTSQVLQSFVAAGAPREILWQAKPHIGTDVLAGVVAQLRERIIACRGEVHFNTKLVGIEADGHGVQAVEIESDFGTVRVPCDAVVLACGHSARDTFEMLRDAGLELVPKPFSMGVRIEHLQQRINRAQYGKAAAHPALGAADYKLNVKLKNGRGVYSFCMCPGGEVVAASSEEGGLCVNGMSNQARDGRNANAALLCDVRPEDFAQYGAAEADPLAGIAFQRAWERAAFEAGGSNWRAPVQSVGEYLGASAPKKLVEPTYPLGVEAADLHKCLPQFVGDSLAQALPLLGKRLSGFDDPGAIMTGIEARSSSPVRIMRDAQTLQATRMPGLYPCGEGAGYAGGIMSAAIDGIRVARAILG